MNFFERQEDARRVSRRLVVLFVIAVIAVVVTVNAASAFTYLAIVPVRHAAGWSAALPNGFFATNTIVALALIGCGTWWQTLRLSSGGEAVARMVGARQVDPSTRDLLEKRLVNVVEEMALAAGVAVPRVYVMDDELAINAFAAGHSLNDAVIAVTRGTLTRLTRDELQGVIGHELSHVINGDMRLNLRLISVLFGLMMIAMFGRFMMELSRGERGKGGGALILAGVVLWIVGYIGVFFGRLIKAGVSRQREYLADASSVQFTRNPDGIGGALRKIGGLGRTEGLGTRIDNAHAETLSHLFLGAARPNFVSGLMATHPPLEERLHRIYGHAVSFVDAPEMPLQAALAAQRAAQPIGPGGLPLQAGVSPVAGWVNESADGSAIANAIGLLTPQATAFGRHAVSGPETGSIVEAALLDSTAVQLLVLGLLIEKDRPMSGGQRELVTTVYGGGAAQQVDALHEAVAQLLPGRRLALLDRAMPALRKLPAASADRLLAACHVLIHDDARVTLPEFLLFTVLKRRIGTGAQRAAPIRFHRVEDCTAEAALVLSLVAAVRAPDRAQQAFAAAVPFVPAVEGLLMQVDLMNLDGVSAALERLNRLAPLAKPQLIKAAAAVAFLEDHTNWQAASCLRTICAALDAPLPPHADAIIDETGD
jgi:Zn-dependent protease with chaperone function